MKKIRLGQIGIGHNHAEAKMYAARKFPELFEIVGYAEENPRWVESAAICSTIAVFLALRSRNLLKNVMQCLWSRMFGI